jgi:hypothetical protein
MEEDVAMMEKKAKGSLPSEHNKSKEMLRSCLS